VFLLAVSTSAFLSLLAGSQNEGHWNPLAQDAGGEQTSGMSTWSPVGSRYSAQHTWNWQHTHTQHANRDTMEHDVLAAFKSAAAKMASLNGTDRAAERSCPGALEPRPQQHAPSRVGDACEPWFTRRALQLLQLLLVPGMAGLEWGVGSSTLWLLSGGLKKLVSIEHDERRARGVESALERTLGAQFLQHRWQLHVVPPSRLPSTFAEAEAGANVFAAYANAAFLRPAAGTFDLVSVDGQARVTALAAALSMVKAHGGVLVLNNSQRPIYSAALHMVPHHWLRFVGANNLGEETTVWVTCEFSRC
jgi:hypothetical protein